MVICKNFKRWLIHVNSYSLIRLLFYFSFVRFIMISLCPCDVRFRSGDRVDPYLVLSLAFNKKKKKK